MLKEIDVKELNLNPFTAFGRDWMALAAGNEARGYNAMTVAWGHLGAIWDRKGGAGTLPTAVCFVRPQRYTKEFMDRETMFTLCAFPPEYKKALAYLGARSGRDEDKIAVVGLTPVFDADTTYFAEASLVLVCRKLYQAPLQAGGFIEPELLEENYPRRDLHEMYIGEIVKALVNRE